MKNIARSSLSTIHRVLRLNYTTYDVRRDQDVINPRTRSDVILLPPVEVDGEHPYQYGHVEAIFHVVVEHVGRGSKIQQQQVFDICWVRRYGLDPAIKGGFKAKRMHRLGRTPDHDRWEYIFVDPKHIIRAAHLIPVFVEGEILDNGVGTGEYNRYYVNPCMSIFCSVLFLDIFRFPDRDMLMRFLGGGVGHVATREAVDKFEKIV